MNFYHHKNRTRKYPLTDHPSNPELCYVWTKKNCYQNTKKRYQCVGCVKKDQNRVACRYALNDEWLCTENEVSHSCKGVLKRDYESN